jgi:hypothetical protein
MDDNVGKYIRGIVGFSIIIFDFFQPPTSTTGWEVGGSQLGGRQWEWAGIEGSACILMVNSTHFFVL